MAAGLFFFSLLSVAVTQDILQAQQSIVQESEAAPSSVCDPVIPPCDPNYKYRSHDGTCNNLANPAWGRPNATYARILPPRYADGLSTPRRAVDGGPLPPARKVRTCLFPEGSVEDPQRTLLLMQWGQIVAHDMGELVEHDGVTECCTDNGQMNKNPGEFCMPISIPPSDPTQGRAGIRCMFFIRAINDRDLWCSNGSKPAQQISQVTPYLDLSLVYGLSDAFNKALRTLKDGLLGQQGRGSTQVQGNRTYPLASTDKVDLCPCSAADENVCYKTGDDRTNQSPHLAILQILLLREHNRLARALKALNPQWDDEKLYQEARLINIAAVQHLTYYEFLPSLLGYHNLIDNEILYPDAGDFVYDYTELVSPAVINEHSTGAYRMFHSQIAGMLKLMSADRITQCEVPISNWFWRPQILEIGSSIDELTLGLATQKSQLSDLVFVEQITDKLFACQGKGYGLDLKAIDIQRDRDHGLGYYNEYRKYCGLKVARCFDDYEDYICKEDITKLKRLYKSHEDVDLSVGGLLEKNVDGAQVGPTFLCIMMEQFRRTRQTDRFWFESSTSGLTKEQLMEIKKSSIARLLCNNGDGIQEIQPSAFEVIGDGVNTPVPCDDIPSIDLNKWKEF